MRPGDSERSVPQELTPQEKLKRDLRELQEKLNEHKRIINTPTQINNAVQSKEIQVVEVADTCTAEQFNDEQSRLLRNWVLKGGVLWVNSDVLELFGVGYSKVPDARDALCIPAGRHSTVDGVATVRLRNISGKSHTLQFTDVIPLLTSKDAGGILGNGLPPGTTLWSLIRYGEGWISDRKEVDLPEGEIGRFDLSGSERDAEQSARFWAQFCKFCLREVDWPPPSPPPPPPGPLMGTWRVSSGALFKIHDDGTTVKVTLLSKNEMLQRLAGTLTRRDGEPDAKFLDGKTDVVFAGDPRTHDLQTIVTVIDQNHLTVLFKGWPIPPPRGKPRGRFEWTRVRMPPTTEHE